MKPFPEGQRRRLWIALAGLGGLLGAAVAPPVLANGPKDDTPEFRPVRVAPAQRPLVDPPLVAADESGSRVTERELVLGVVVDGEARAYPVNMLTGPRREIINDVLGGRAIAATW